MKPALRSQISQKTISNWSILPSTLSEYQAKCFVIAHKHLGLFVKIYFIFKTSSSIKENQAF